MLERCRRSGRFMTATESWPGAGDRATGRRRTEVGDPVPPTIGLGVNAVRAPDPVVSRCAERVVTKGGDQRGTARRATDLWPRRAAGRAGCDRSDDVMPKWHVRRASRGCVVVGPAAEERDDIVLGGGLDLGDGFRVGGFARRTGSMRRAAPTGSACAARTRVSTRYHSRTVRLAAIRHHLRSV